MKNFISVHNVPVSLEERIFVNKIKCVIYVNCYSWIIDIDDYYEFYYTPNHFIGKISHLQMPPIVIDRIRKSYKTIKSDDFGYGQTSAPLQSSTIRFQKLEKTMRVGIWYHAQGQNYATFDNTFVCDDMYVPNCGRKCSFSQIDAAIIYDMLRMGCQTRTPHYYNGIFDFPCFQGIDTGEIVIYPFDGMKWDAERWLSEFNYLLKYKSRRTIDDIRNMRVMVFQHTVSVVNMGYYHTISGKKVIVPDSREMVQNTCFYCDEIVAIDSKKEFVTQYNVENMDCLNAAKRLQDDGYNVAVLNMASRQNPGGGVYGGAGAQEENIFRRTDLFKSMFQFASYASQYGLPQSSNQYPLNRNYGGVYTPNAFVFRDVEDKGYELMDSPFHMSFISVPGMNKPDLTAEGMIAEYHVEPIKNKIRTIFRIGLIHNHDALVLGALGCGAFRNPPKHIAKLFHEVINEPEFKNKYRRIVFAIIDDQNSYLSHNPEGNVRPFEDEFL